MADRDVRQQETFRFGPQLRPAGGGSRITPLSPTSPRENRFTNMAKSLERLGGATKNLLALEASKNQEQQQISLAGDTSQARVDTFKFNQQVDEWYRESKDLEPGEWIKSFDELVDTQVGDVSQINSPAYRKVFASGVDKKLNEVYAAYNQYQDQKIFNKDKSNTSSELNQLFDDVSQDHHGVSFEEYFASNQRDPKFLDNISTTYRGFITVLQERANRGDTVLSKSQINILGIHIAGAKAIEQGDERIMDFAEYSDERTQPLVNTDPEIKRLVEQYREKARNASDSAERQRISRYNESVQSSRKSIFNNMTKNYYNLQDQAADIASRIDSEADGSKKADLRKSLAMINSQLKNYRLMSTAMMDIGDSQYVIDPSTLQGDMKELTEDFKFLKDNGEAYLDGSQVAILRKMFGSQEKLIGQTLTVIDQANIRTQQLGDIISKWENADRFEKQGLLVQIKDLDEATWAVFNERYKQGQKLGDKASSELYKSAKGNLTTAFKGILKAESDQLIAEFEDSSPLSMAGADADLEFTEWWVNYHKTDEAQEKQRITPTRAEADAKIKELIEKHTKSANEVSINSLQDGQDRGIWSYFARRLEKSDDVSTTKVNDDIENIALDLISKNWTNKDDVANVLKQNNISPKKIAAIQNRIEQKTGESTSGNQATMQRIGEHENKKEFLTSIPKVTFSFPKSSLDNFPQGIQFLKDALYETVDVWNVKDQENFLSERETGFFNDMLNFFDSDVEFDLADNQVITTDDVPMSIQFTADASNPKFRNFMDMMGMDYIHQLSKSQIADVAKSLNVTVTKEDVEVVREQRSRQAELERIRGEILNKAQQDFQTSQDVDRAVKLALRKQFKFDTKSGVSSDPRSVQEIALYNKVSEVLKKKNKGVSKDGQEILNTLSKFSFNLPNESQSNINNVRLEKGNKPNIWLLSWKFKKREESGEDGFQFNDKDILEQVLGNLDTESKKKFGEKFKEIEDQKIK